MKPIKSLQILALILATAALGACSTRGSAQVGVDRGHGHGHGHHGGTNASVSAGGSVTR